MQVKIVLDSHIFAFLFLELKGSHIQFLHKNKYLLLYMYQSLMNPINAFL